MRKVIFLGLNAHDIAIDKAEILSSEVWTMNDWFRPYPWLNGPAKVFQIHTDIDECIEKAPDYRWIDWVNEYKKSNAEIVTLKYDGRWDIQRVLSAVGLVEKYNAWFFNQTLSYMAALAIDSGVTEVKMVGFGMLDEPGRMDCFPGCIGVVDKMRDCGIKIESNIFEMWVKKQALQGIKDYFNRDKTITDMYGWMN
jgi:hypothetical protein